MYFSVGPLWLKKQGFRQQYSMAKRGKRGAERPGRRLRIRILNRILLLYRESGYSKELEPYALRAWRRLLTEKPGLAEEPLVHDRYGDDDSSSDTA